MIDSIDFQLLGLNDECKLCTIFTAPVQKLKAVGEFILREIHKQVIKICMENIISKIVYRERLRTLLDS